jgi:outer membrane protein
MRKILLLVMLTLISGYADTIGGEISAGIYSHSPKGHASYDLLSIGTDSSHDLERTFGFTDSQDLFFKGYLEHPMPMLPNFKLGYISFSTTGTRNVELFSWGDISQFTGTIANKLTLDITDVTLYYELLDNWAEVDAGLTFRHISGDMRVATKPLAAFVDFSTTTPMLYGKLRTHIPSTDISLQLEANAIAFTGINAYDYELSARYTFYMGLGVEAGYKTFYLENDEFVDTLDVDIEFTGPYAAVIWDF